MRQQILRSCRALSLLTAFAFLLPACKNFEYAADEITVDENTIQVGNVGFKGYVLNPLDSFELLSESDLANNPRAMQWVEALRIGYRNSEGIDYHFHQDFVFQKDGKVIFFVPFQNKTIRQFRHTPPDILERYLVDWVRDAEFSKIIDYDLSWRTESDSRGHSTVILYSDPPKKGWTYEQRIMTGDLNEMFIFAGFVPTDEAPSLSKYLKELATSMTVIR